MQPIFARGNLRTLQRLKALRQYDGLFKEQAPPLDWDDEKRNLTIVDPHFYFFLRNYHEKK
jgi:hypothetical protein